MSFACLWSPVFSASPVPPLTHTAIKPSRGVWHPLMARPVSTAPPNLHRFSHDRSRKVSPMYLTTTKFPLVSQYLTKAVLDETAYEWQQYVRFSVRFKLHLRHLFLNIPFESQITDDPLLKAAAFLQEAFRRDKSLREYSQQAFPKACIPEKWKKYLYEIKTVP